MIVGREKSPSSGTPWKANHKERVGIASISAPVPFQVPGWITWNFFGR